MRPDKRYYSVIDAPKLPLPLKMKMHGNWTIIFFSPFVKGRKFLRILASKCRMNIVKEHHYIT